jgi:hypothetical protein
MAMVAGVTPWYIYNIVVVVVVVGGGYYGKVDEKRMNQPEKGTIRDIFFHARTFAFSIDSSSCAKSIFWGYGIPWAAKGNKLRRKEE